MFAHHVGGLKGGVPPSRVGMQGRQALLHQAKIEKQVTRLSDVHSFFEFIFPKNLSLLTPAPVKTIEMGGTNQALVVIPNGLQEQLLTDWIEFGEHVIEE
jgi:hypothetical protein